MAFSEIGIGSQQVAQNMTPFAVTQTPARDLGSAARTELAAFAARIANPQLTAAGVAQIQKKAIALLRKMPADGYEEFLRDVKYVFLDAKISIVSRHADAPSIAQAAALERCIETGALFDDPASPQEAVDWISAYIYVNADEPRAPGRPTLVDRIKQLTTRFADGRGADFAEAFLIRLHRRLVDLIHRPDLISLGERQGSYNRRQRGDDDVNIISGLKAAVEWLRSARGDRDPSEDVQSMILGMGIVNTRQGIDGFTADQINGILARTTAQLYALPPPQRGSFLSRVVKFLARQADREEGEKKAAYRDLLDFVEKGFVFKRPYSGAEAASNIAAFLEARTFFFTGDDLGLKFHREGPGGHALSARDERLLIAFIRLQLQRLLEREKAACQRALEDLYHRAYAGAADAAAVQSVLGEIAHL